MDILPRLRQHRRNRLTMLIKVVMITSRHPKLC